MLITFFIGYFSFAQNYEIPVVFHIISHPDKDISALDNIDFNTLITNLNHRFNNTIKGNIPLNFHKDIGFPNITFRLAIRDKNNNVINPITYSSINYKRLGVSSVLQLDLDVKKLKNLIQYDTKNYLNIYFTNISDKSNQPAGHYSKLIDSVILDIDELIYISTDPFLLVHEIGHYLGLKHVWGKDVDPNFPFKDGCDYDDGINDTPPQKYAHSRLPPPDKIQDSCGGIGKTNYQNYMDYSYVTGMFTKMQAVKMRSNINFNRKELLWKPKTAITLNSILSNTKQRDKLGTRMLVNNLYPYGTITDKDMVELFNSTGIIPTSENLQKLGLKIIANNKFLDTGTGKEVNQDYIYKYLDIEKTKEIIKTNSKITRINRVKFVKYYDVKERKFYSQIEFPKLLKQHQVEAYEKENENNLLLLNYSIGMNYKIYQNGKLITPQNLSSNKHINSFNLETGTYQIICSVKSFYLGNGMKEIEYTKKLADITFEHLTDSKQTILIIKGDNNNRIFHKK